MVFFRRRFSRTKDNTQLGGDDRSGILSYQRSSFDAARHPPVSSSEVEQHREPFAQKQQYLSNLAAHALRPGASPSQERIQAEINDAITGLRDNIETLNQGDRSLPRRPEQLRREYKQIKREILDEWPRMLAAQTPTASYNRTLEFKQLRNRKSEFRIDPNGYIDRLRDFQRRMFDPVTAIHNEIEEQPFKSCSLAQIERYTRRYSPLVLLKLQGLSPAGLGNKGESKQDLIDMYEAMEKKLGKTVFKLNLIVIPFIVTIMASEIFTGKKHKNLLRSASFYHNWRMTIDRQIDAFQNRNQNAF